MRPSKARRILDHDEEMDIGQMAEAALELEKRKVKPKKHGDPLISWRMKQALDNEEELRRLRVAALWNKYKKGAA